MGQHNWNGHGQPQHGGHQSLGNTAGHHARVAGTEQSHDMKGVNHAGDRAEQSDKRCDGGQHTQGGQKSFHGRHFT